MRAAIFVCLVGCAHVQPIETSETSLSNIHLTTRRVSYAVRGRGIGDVRAAMKRIGPIDDGRHQFAHTWGMFAWSYPYEERDGICRTGKVTVELEIVQTFPDWLGRHRTGAAREWSRWLAATKNHEEGHRKILLATAQGIASQLGEVEPQPTCEILDRMANEKGAALLVEMRQRHAKYDRDTQHGKATGAFLGE